MFAPGKIVLGLGVIVCLPTLAPAGNWPQFRGADNAGVVAEAGLPEKWSADQNIAWKARIPGYGWSSPIVWGDKIFVTTAVSDKQQKPAAGMGGFGGFGRRGGGFPRRPPRGDFPPPRGGDFPPRGRFGGGFRGGRPPDAVYRWEVLCLDRATGKTLWKRVAAERKPATPINSSNTYASETPVTDGERVYAYFGMTGVFCYDLNGKLLWKKELGSYPMMFGHGTGASPALAGDRLFIQCDNEEKSFLAALDKKTGKELWRVPRDERSTWSTPFVWTNKDRTEVVCGGRTVRAYDPATGKVLWRLGGMSGQFCATPVADRERLYIGAGGPFGNSPLVAVRAGAGGDITPKEGAGSSAGVAWSRSQAGPPMASPLLFGGHLYVLEQRMGVLNCYEAKTGKKVYKERLPQARGFTSSPWAQGGKIFCLDEDGRTFVVKAGPKFELLGKNELKEMFWSSPAAADGALLLRGVEHLYCVKSKGETR